jgi:signal transduction histidine kinase
MFFEQNSKVTMLQVFFQAFCISLFTIGVCLVIIELRSNFNRSFLNFGFIVILLSLFSSLDLWQPKVNTTVFWASLQHVIFCPIPPLILDYLLNLSKKSNPRLKMLFIYWGSICCILFVSGIMFKADGNHFSATILYYLAFIPFLVSSVSCCIAILVTSLNTAPSQTRPVIILYLLSFAIFTFFASWDLIRLLTRIDISNGISYMTFGILLMGIIFTYIFTENLISLTKDRLSFINKLQNTYKELEHARDLSELGKSTSIINHEIKNYCFIIKGYAEVIKETAQLEEHHQKMVESIISSVEDMSRFSKEILDFSRAKIITNRPLNISSFLLSCIEKKFGEKKDMFLFSNAYKEVMVHGDWNKLEHVFVNLFMNAIEAQATLITIKFIETQFVVLITIEDNGVGCNNEQLSNLFTAFFTTKDKGTGLGLATTRAIIEGHGGHISVTSKNVISGGKEQGCIFNISFPTATETNDKKDNIILIEEKISRLPSVIQTFMNVHTNPYVLPSLCDLDQNRFKPLTFKVIAHPECIADIKKCFGDYHCFSLIETVNEQIFVVECLKGKDAIEHAFSEEFIISTLMKNI